MAKSMQKRMFDSVDTLIFNTITGTMLVTKKELDENGNETFKIMNSETGKYESKQLDLTDDYQVINLQSPIETDQQRSIAYYLDSGDSFSAFKEIMSRCAGINKLEEVFGSKIDDIKKLCKEQYDDKVRANENLKKSNPTVNYEYQKNLFNELSKLNIAEDLINYKCKDNPELLNEINENKSEYFSNEYLKFQNNIEKNALLRESYNFSKEEIKAYKYYNVEPNFHGVYRELFAPKPLISSVVIPLICKFIGLCSMIKHAGSPYAVEYFKKWSLLHPIGASSEKMRYIRQHKQEFLSKFDQLIKGVETDTLDAEKIDSVSTDDDPNLFDNLIKEYKDTANSKANEFETLKNKYDELAQKSLDTAERIKNLEEKLEKTSDPDKIEKIKNDIKAEKEIKDKQMEKLKDLKEQIDKKVPEIKDLIEKNKLDVEKNEDDTEKGNEDSQDKDGKNDSDKSDKDNLVESNEEKGNDGKLENPEIITKEYEDPIEKELTDDDCKEINNLINELNELKEPNEKKSDEIDDKLEKLMDRVDKMEDSPEKEKLSKQINILNNKFDAVCSRLSISDINEIGEKLYAIRQKGNCTLEEAKEIESMIKASRDKLNEIKDPKEKKERNINLGIIEHNFAITLKAINDKLEKTNNYEPEQTVDDSLLISEEQTEQLTEEELEDLLDVDIQNQFEVVEEEKQPENNEKNIENKNNKENKTVEKQENHQNKDDKIEKPTKENEKKSANNVKNVQIEKENKIDKDKSKEKDVENEKIDKNSKNIEPKITDKNVIIDDKTDVISDIKNDLKLDISSFVNAIDELEKTLEESQLLFEDPFSKISEKSPVEELKDKNTQSDKEVYDKLKSFNNLNEKINLQIDNFKFDKVIFKIQDIGILLSEKFDLYKEKNDVTAKIENLKAEIESLGYKIDNLNDVNKEYKQLLKEHNAEIKTYEKEMSNFSKLDNKISNEAKSISDNLQKLEKQIEKNETKIDSLSKEKITLENEKVALENRLSKVESEIETKNAQIESELRSLYDRDVSKDVVDATKNEKLGLEKEKKYLEKEIEKTKNEIKSKELEISKKENENKNVKTEIDSLKEKSTTLTSDLSKNETNINNITEKIDSNNQKFELLESKLKELSDSKVKLAELTNSINIYEKESGIKQLYSELTNDLKEVPQSIKANCIESTNLSNELKSVIDKSINEKTNLIDLLVKGNGKDSEIAKLSDEISAFEKAKQNIDGNVSKLDQMSNKTDKIVENFKDLQVENDKIFEKIFPLSFRLDVLLDAASDDGDKTQITNVDATIDDTVDDVSNDVVDNDDNQVDTSEGLEPGQNPEDTPVDDNNNDVDATDVDDIDDGATDDEVVEQPDDVTDDTDDNKTENTNDNSDENEKNKNLTDIAKDIDKKSPYSNVEQDEKGVKVDELNSSKDVDFKYFISCADKTVPNHIRIEEVGGQNINLEITLKKGIEGENRLFQTLEAAKNIKYEKEIDETYFENIMGNISKGDILTINEKPAEIALKDKEVTNSFLSMIEFLSEDMKNEINDISEQNVENKVEENEEDEKTDSNEKSEDTTQDDDKPDFNDFESIEI